MPEKPMRAYIVTLRRTPDAAPEGYYVTATSPDHAKRRALRLARDSGADILDVLAA